MRKSHQPTLSQYTVILFDYGDMRWQVQYLRTTGPGRGLAGYNTNDRRHVIIIAMSVRSHAFHTPLQWVHIVTLAMMSCDRKVATV